MGAVGDGWEEEGDPVPSRESWVSAGGQGRQQALSPPGPQVLRSGKVGQVVFDTQQGCSLMLVAIWSTMYTLGSSTLSLGWLLSRVVAVHGEQVMAKLLFLLFLWDTHYLLLLQPHQELPLLT